jgi:hypothetical protein
MYNLEKKIDDMYFPGDENKSESYLRRRNLLLGLMKNQRWDAVDDRPMKPLKQKVEINFIDPTKYRNNLLLK